MSPPAEAAAALAMPPAPAFAAAAQRCTAGGASLERQARRRMILAIAAAGLLALFASAAFYLFELERATRQQSAALAHYLGQAVLAAEARWDELGREKARAVLRAADPAEALETLGGHFVAAELSGAGPARRGFRSRDAAPPAADPWQHDPTHGRFLRNLRIDLEDGRRLTLQAPLDRHWLAAQSRPDLRLFLATTTAAVATSLGDAGAGEAAALEPLVAGLVQRGDSLFVQAPLRWDSRPDSPILVAQQRLSLMFSLGEVAASGLLFWGFLAAMIWVAVGVWLHDALRQVQFLAYHDPLTGLINRAALLVGLTHMLAESRRNGDFLALLYLDLDRFKTINDSLGHAAGDHVLVETAQRLSACVRDTDFVARLGGDEFVVVLGGLQQPQDAVPVARKAIRALAGPITFHGRELHTSSAVGIAVFPTDTADRDTLLKHADSAMYAAKQAGRGVFRYYDSGLGAQADQRLLLEERLRRAVAERRFVLHYQPIVACRPAAALVGFEALLRWPDGASEGMTPERIVPVAEETGLIVPLGDWVLATACAQMQAWRAAAPERCGALTMAVNVSLKQLLSDDFPGRLAAILARTGLPPERLELEITESLYAERYGSVPGILAQLRALGAHLSIDDFGTGYSALASLTRLPVDRLKIDRSFVRRIADCPDELALARTIVAIGRQLGIEVVAEGVENAEQMALLAGAGCELMQGWLFGRALPDDQVLGWMEAFSRRGADAARGR
ncbi:MAG: bifunctional diguanylate cyclase/phosphodiesterase [Rhodocyclaceae bacterium]|nr:bifunctional diguanylate cyclase/phosphodiesterase [Rhodocyclaceae bacterium]